MYIVISSVPVSLNEDVYAEVVHIPLNQWCLLHISPYYSKMCKFSPIFVFSRFGGLPHTFTMMRLCVMLYTYWTLLYTLILEFRHSPSYIFKDLKMSVWALTETLELMSLALYFIVCVVCVMWLQSISFTAFVCLQYSAGSDPGRLSPSVARHSRKSHSTAAGEHWLDDRIHLLSNFSFLFLCACWITILPYLFINLSNYPTTYRSLDSTISGGDLLLPCCLLAGIVYRSL